METLVHQISHGSDRTRGDRIGAVEEELIRRHVAAPTEAGCLQILKIMGPIVKYQYDIRMDPGIMPFEDWEQYAAEKIVRLLADYDPEVINRKGLPSNPAYFLIFGVTKFCQALAYRRRRELRTHILFELQPPKTRPVVVLKHGGESLVEAKGLDAKEIEAKGLDAKGRAPYALVARNRAAWTEPTDPFQACPQWRWKDGVRQSVPVLEHSAHMERFKVQIQGVTTATTGPSAGRALALIRYINAQLLIQARWPTIQELAATRFSSKLSAAEIQDGLYRAQRELRISVHESRTA